MLPISPVFLFPWETRGDCNASLIHRILDSSYFVLFVCYKVWRLHFWHTIYHLWTRSSDPETRPEPNEPFWALIGQESHSHDSHPVLLIWATDGLVPTSDLNFTSIFVLVAMLPWRTFQVAASPATVILHSLLWCTWALPINCPRPGWQGKNKSSSSYAFSGQSMASETLVICICYGIFKLVCTHVDRTRFSFFYKLQKSETAIMKDNNIHDNVHKQPA